jgi:acetyl esterase/lipase
VPWGYLLSVGIVAVCTFTAAVPLRHPPTLGRLSWVLGMIPNELPFIVFYYVAAATLVAALQGDLGNAVGGIALGIALLTAAALAVIVVRAVRTGPAARSAMRDALGIDVPRRRLPMPRILLAPFSVTRRDVAHTANVAYGDAGAANRLDVYRPRAGPSTGCVLIHFHGGGFRSGRKNREARPLIYRLASEGWLCVSANYRLGPVRFYESLDDAERVVKWLREHAADYGSVATHVFVSGSSAGGHLATTAAFRDPSIAGAISLYGYYGPAEEGQRLTSPLGYVGPDAPPLFVAHGDNDTYVPVEAARELVERTRSVSANPVVYVEAPGGQHSFDLFHSIRFERVIDGIEAFTSWVRAHHGPPDRPHE